MTFDPARPRAGEAVRVTYRPSPALAGERELRLRARFRPAGSRDDNADLGSREAAILTRGDDGRFRGVVRLPAGHVYAALAVETADGGRVERWQGRFRELLAHDAAGRPFLDALEARVVDAMERDRLLALDAVREMTRHHPDRVDAWSARSQVEPWALGTTAAAAVMDEHVARFRATDSTLRARPSVSDEEAEAMYPYAYSLNQPEAVAWWRARIREQVPGGGTAVSARLRELHREHAGDRARLLRELEALWSVAHERARADVAASALEAAVAGGDVAAASAWGDRLEAVSPRLGAAWVARALAGSAATRPEGIRRLRAELRATDAAPDERRVLGATQAEHEVAMREEAAGLRMSLARALDADGPTAEGLALLEEAAAVGWSTPRFRRLGGARLEAGDTAGALSVLARAAADPGMAPAAADSLRMRVGASPSAWVVAVEQGRREMLRATLAAARPGGVPEGRLVEGGGQPVRLRDRLGRQATVVHVWSSCPASHALLPQVQSLRQRLARDGVPLLAVTWEPREWGASMLREAGLDLGALFDEHGEATRALGSWLPTQTFILDGAGRIRFAYGTLEDVERQVAALRAESTVQLRNQ